MYTPAQRDEIRDRLLERARLDDGITGAAITGSIASGNADDWSDIDLAFAVPGDLHVALDRWTTLMYEEFGALHHWDLPFRATIYRVFLLPGWLEVDLAFAPPAEFGPRAPSWRTVFGDAVENEPNPIPTFDELVGYAWHHVLHARASIERARPWLAEYMISGIRDKTITMGCLRLGLSTAVAKGADELPGEVKASVEPALVRSLDASELRRALSAAARALILEIERADPALAARLSPMIDEIAQ
jgi:nucleotidyltransferase-like protein